MPENPLHVLDSMQMTKETEEFTVKCHTQGFYDDFIRKQDSIFTDKSPSRAILTEDCNWSSIGGDKGCTTSLYKDVILFLLCATSCVNYGKNELEN